MRKDEHTAISGDPAAEAHDDAAGRRARAARIRRRSGELVDALGADHPLVAEALARADALEADLPARSEPWDTTSRAERRVVDDGPVATQDGAGPGGGDRGLRLDDEGPDGTGEIDLRSSADVRR